MPEQLDFDITVFITTNRTLKIEAIYLVSAALINLFCQKKVEF